MRCDLHSVFLSVPDMVPKEQVLLHMQNLQLGLRHDVHTALFREESVYMESAGIVRSASHEMGDYIFPPSGAVFG
jgi:hypothetical protein